MNSSCCWLFPCGGWIVVVLDIVSFIRRRIIKVSGTSRTCAHLGSWIGWILLISLFLCHKILTQKFNSIVFIDRSGIWKERKGDCGPWRIRSSNEGMSDPRRAAGLDI
jgi:hypothetical protein